MKNEKAIEILNALAWVQGGADREETITAISMAIEALQAEPTHGRLIDADALMEYCSNQKSKTISNNDIARFPTVSPDRPHGEWIDKGDYAVCSECGGSSGTQYDGVERIPRITTFCPHCGVRMTKGGENE